MEGEARAVGGKLPRRGEPREEGRRPLLEIVLLVGEPRIEKIGDLLVEGARRRVDIEGGDVGAHADHQTPRLRPGGARLRPAGGPAPRGRDEQCSGERKANHGRYPARWGHESSPDSA